MKPFSKIIFGVLYASLFLASTHVPALTLGRLQGPALLGKELDVAVTVQYAAEEDVSANCFDAELRVGDLPLERSRFTISVQPGAQAGTQTVRIVSRAHIEDAVVTINLKTLCGQKTSRRYVLLSDVVSDTVPSASAMQPQPSGASVELVAAGKEVRAAQTGSIALPPAVASRPAKPVARVKKQTEDAPNFKALPAASVEKANAVKAASQANTLAVEELQRRVESVEQWQAKTMVADDLLKSSERANALQSDIQGLKLITAKNQQNLQTVATALEQAESESYGRSLVYSLGALLAACVAAVAYVASKLRSSAESGPWWMGGGEQRAQVDAAPLRTANVPSAVQAKETVAAKLATPVEVASPKVATPKAETPKAAALPTQAVDVDFDIGLNDDMRAETAGDPSVVGFSGQATEPASVQPEVMGSAQSQLRAINTKEMLDIRQQAEFFMALGQHDDAVGLLESSIRDNADANPLVFLDLLKIFHTLSRRADFERYREEFNAHFTGRIPSYTDFLMEGNGLDAYEDICQQIVVLWPTEYTIDFIEQCLVRTAEDDPEQGIDLEAFKDLLLLYGVLKRLDQANDSVMVPFSTSRTANSQMGAQVEVGSAPSAYLGADDAAALPAITGEEGGATVDLDLDLDLNAEQPPSDQAPQGNLIDFDMSGFVKPEPGNGPKQ